MVARLLFASFIVFATYNPTGRSYYHWVAQDDVLLEWKLVASGLLLIAYGVIVPVVLRALGLGGVLLTFCVATTTTWLLMEAGFLTIDGARGWAWVDLTLLTVVLGVGLCWMTVARALDGQSRIVDLTRP